MKNAKGFGVVEVVIVLVILGLMGIGVWYAWETHNKPSAPSQSLDTPTIDNEHASFQQPPAPFTFTYPKSWTIHTDKALQAGQPLPNSYGIRLTSPDIVLTEMPIGSTFVTTGAQITIDVSKTDTDDIDNTFTGFRSYIKNQKQTTVAGEKAAEYEFGYEGQPEHYFDFIKTGYLYSVHYASANDERASSAFKYYLELISSWTFR